MCCVTCYIISLIYRLCYFTAPFRENLKLLVHEALSYRLCYFTAPFVKTLSY